MAIIPPNAPKIVLPDGRTVAIAMETSIVGSYLVAAELQPDGTWSEDQLSGDQNAISDFAAAVAAAGGALKWLQTVGIAQINAVMAAKYKPQVGPIADVNGVLAQCKLTLKNGVPGFY